MFRKPSTNPVSVFVVDDEPLFRLGLCTALGQDGDVSVVGECSLPDGAVERVCTSRPQVALVGASPPRHEGLRACREITQRCPDTHVIVMTHAEESGELFEAIRSGAWGYIGRLADARAILRAVREAGQGHMPLQDMMTVYPDVTRRLLEEFHTMAQNPRLRRVMAPLSSREMELLRQLGKGLSNKEIAHTLSITPQTVKNHISSIMRKLDVNDRTQAVLAGLRHGWITLEEESPDGAPLVPQPSTADREDPSALRRTSSSAGRVRTLALRRVSSA